MPELQTNSASAGPEPQAFPPGLANAFLFAAFNALSFQMVLSSPMVLYARTLGASATVLGILRMATTTRRTI